MKMIDELYESFSKEAIDDRCGLLNGAKEHFDKYIKPEYTVVEIGTHNGVSTAYLSKLCKRVITIDIVYRPLAKSIWDKLGLDNINYFVINKDEAKEILLKNIGFDFAFIDGDHDGYAPTFDFSLVERCGKVLIDDSIIEGVQKLIKHIGVANLVHHSDGISYWERNG